MFLKCTRPTPVNSALLFCELPMLRNEDTCAVPRLALRCASHALPFPAQSEHAEPLGTPLAMPAWRRTAKYDQRTMFKTHTRFLKGERKGGASNVTSWSSGLGGDLSQTLQHDGGYGNCNLKEASSSNIKAHAHYECSEKL